MILLRMADFHLPRKGSPNVSNRSLFIGCGLYVQRTLYHFQRKKAVLWLMMTLVLQVRRVRTVHSLRVITQPH